MILPHSRVEKEHEDVTSMASTLQRLLHTPQSIQSSSTYEEDGRMADIDLLTEK